MKITKLPSGSYHTQIQVNGIRKSITASSKAEVKRLAHEFAISRSDAPSAPLGILIDNYIDSKRNVLSPSTVERYERIRKKDFQRLMTVPVRELTSDRIQAEVNLMSAKYAPKTVRNAYGLITATLDLYAPTIKFKVTMPKKRKVVYNVPTTEEVNSLIMAAGDNMRTAIMLAAYCGLRRGEIAALDASDIEGDTLHVRRSAVYDPDGKMVMKTPKTYHSDRYVDIPDIVKKQLSGKTDRICPIALSTITREFDGLRDKLGLKCRFHDLRHYYASVLHAIGIPDQYIMEQGGWKSDFMLKAVYRNTLDDIQQKNRDRINAFFSEKSAQIFRKCKQSAYGNRENASTMRVNQGFDSPGSHCQDKTVKLL